MSVVADRVITEFDTALRTIFGGARGRRPAPGEGLPEAALSDDERHHVVGLMRVNHCGEVCAQALYQGQSLTSDNEAVRAALRQAADEETEHLAWTATRLHELGGRTSPLNPLWYAGALSLGMLAGRLGDKWNLGFLAETERQVESHLEGHLGRLPSQDRRSRAILGQMKADEAGHAQTAAGLGAADLPVPVRLSMRAAAKLMTAVAYYL